MIVSEKIHKILLDLNFKYFYNTYNKEEYIIIKNNLNIIIFYNNKNLCIKLSRDLKYNIFVHDIEFFSEIELYYYLYYDLNFKNKIRTLKLNIVCNESK